MSPEAEKLVFVLLRSAEIHKEAETRKYGRAATTDVIDHMEKAATMITTLSADLERVTRERGLLHESRDQKHVMLLKAQIATEAAEARVADLERQLAEVTTALGERAMQAGELTAKVADLTKALAKYRYAATMCMSVGGTNPTLSGWWDKMVEAQQNAAIVCPPTEAEFVASRAALASKGGE